MTIHELIEALRGLKGSNDPEDAHHRADRLMLSFINDKQVTEAFDAIRKWYA